MTTTNGNNSSRGGLDSPWVFWKSNSSAEMETLQNLKTESYHKLDIKT